MTRELSRVSDSDYPGHSYVTRVKDGAVEILKEIVSTTGEEVDPTNEMISTEVITIVRKVGEKIQF